MDTVVLSTITSATGAGFFIGWLGRQYISAFGRRAEKVVSILANDGGGVYKRIDEGRELLALLHQDAPAFMESHQWVEGWIRSQDQFLVALANAAEPHLNPIPRFPKRPGFPRPWQGKTVSRK